MKDTVVASGIRSKPSLVRKPLLLISQTGNLITPTDGDDRQPYCNHEFVWREIIAALDRTGVTCLCQGEHLFARAGV